MCWQCTRPAAGCIENIRAGNGPYLLEIMTYRFRGHSMGDPERYRKPEEVQKWQENDPIGIYRRNLIEEEIATEAELDEHGRRWPKTKSGSGAICRSQPGAGGLKSLFKHIYVEE